MKTQTSIARLDALLTGLEKLVLDAESEDIGARGSEAAVVRRAMARRLSAQTARKVDVTTAFASQLSKLRELATGRPELRSRLALALRDAERPTREELDALIDEFLPSAGRKDSNK